MVYNNIQYENNNYTSNTFILENYEKFNNTEIVFNAYIKEINNTNNIIKAKIGDPPYTLLTIETNDIINNLHKEDIIFVVGILNGKSYIRAEKIFVIDQFNNTIIILISILAIPYIIYLFLRNWKFNKKTFKFERREINA
jgi:hypothetical protein